MAVAIDKIRPMDLSNNPSLGTAINGLTAKQAALVLSTKNLSSSKLEKVVKENDLMAAYGAENLIKSRLISTNSALLASEKAVSAVDLKSNLIQKGLSKTQAQLLIQKNLSTVTNGQESSSVVLLNKAMMDEAVQKGILTQKNANEVLSSFGIVSADAAETASKEALTTAIRKQVSAQAALIASNPLTRIAGAAVLIFGIVKAIDHFTTSTEEAMESLESSTSAFDDTSKELKSLNEELQTTADRIRELERLENAGTLSVAEEDELETLKEQNRELEKQITLKKQKQIEAAENVLKDLGNADLEVTSKYDTEKVRGSENGNKITRAEEAENAQEYYGKLLQQRYQLQEQEEELLEKQRSGNFTTEDTYESSNYGHSRQLVESDQTKLKNVQKSLDSLESELQETDDYIGDLYNEDAQKKLSAYQSLIDNGIKLEDTQQADYENLKALEDLYIIHCYRIQQTEDAYKALNEEQKKSVLLDKLKSQGYTDEQSQAVVEAIDENDLDHYYSADFRFTLPDISDYDDDQKTWAKDFVTAWADHVTKEAVSQIPDSFSDIYALEDTEGTATALSSLKDSIHELTSAYQALSAAAEEYRSTGALSFSAIESLIESGDDWLNYLTIEDGQLKINEQAYYDMAQAKLYELKVQALQNLSEQVKGLENVRSAQAWIENQNYNTADSYRTLADSIIQKSIAELEEKKSMAGTDSDKKIWQETIDYYKKYADEISQTIDSVDMFSMLSDSTSVLSDSLSNAQTTANLINTVKKELQENGEISISTLKDIASAYPVLEKYVQDYMIGEEGSQEALVDQLNSLYQQDVENYKQAWQLKAMSDESFWGDFLNTRADSINTLANQYGIDLKNYSNYAQAEETINIRLAESYHKLILAKNAANTMTSGSDIFTSAQFAGLNSTQKTQIDTLWAQWKKEYLQDRSSVTIAAMEQKLNTISGLDRVASAKDIAEELYHNIILLPDSQTEYDGLSNLMTRFTDSWNQYSAEYAEKVSSSFSDPGIFDSAASGMEETFDWIEIKITHLIEALDRLKTKTGNTYETWTSRNKALADAIGSTQQAIGLQLQAYNLYMQQADSIGLSESYKKLVKNGSMNLSVISDETLKTRINDYKEWYDKAQDCLKTQQDLTAELNEFKTQKFDNIKSEYDSILTRMQSAYDLLQSQITLLSSGSDYNTLRIKQNAIISQLQSERSILADTLNSSGIQMYTEAWYNLVSQIDDLDQQISDAKNTFREIDTLQFDNLKEVFDFDTGVLEHGLQTIQNQADLLEMKGLFAKESYYNGMAAYTQRQLDTLAKERTELQNILKNTAYSQGTSEWNNMYSTLMEIDEEIDSMTNNLTEFHNSIRSLNWEIFEYLEEALNRITGETDYLIELLSKKDLYDKETGNVTEYAAASIGLHAAAYDVYRQQAQDYYEEVQDLQSQLTNGAGKDVLEQYHAMVDAHQDAILAAEDEKQAILDLIEEGYHAQLDALQNLIDKKKEQMQAEKNLYDYQKSIREQTENIASLEKQQTSYAGDDSEEAMSRIQQIKVQLEEAREELAETEYEQYLSDTETMLDQLASDYELWMNERLDHSDALLSEIAGEISGQSQSIMETLNSVGAEYGTMISDSIISVFHSDSPFTSALTGGLSNVSTAVAGTTAAINALISSIAGITGASSAATNAGSGQTQHTAAADTGSNSAGKSSASAYSVPKTGLNTSGSTSSLSGKSFLDSILIDKYDGYPKSKLNIDFSIVDRLKYNNKDSSWEARSLYWSKLFPEAGAYTGSASQNTRLLNYLKSNGYRNGTPGVGRAGYHWTQEDGSEIILRRSDGAVLTPLGKGDAVLNSNATKNFYDMFNDPRAFRQRMDAGLYNGTLSLAGPAINDNRNQDITMGDIHVTIDLPNVKNYSDFRNDLVKDRDFEKSMCVMINNAMKGKSTIEKLKYCR